MTPHPDKNFVARLRAITDPVRILGIVVKRLGASHPDGDNGALIRHAKRVCDLYKRDRERHYRAIARARDRLERERAAGGSHAISRRDQADRLRRA